MEIERRDFLRLAAASAGVAATSGMGTEAIARALALPANRVSGTIADVEHVVILMQENRSFDHYFGTLRGVRGFDDPRPIPLPGGRSVWFQPKATGSPETLLPFRLNTQTSSAQSLQSLDHSWKGSHDKWKHYDAWPAAKGPLTMGHFTRQDVPFYHALADAFTICDAYHCSLFGPTNPNRMFLFTGTSGLAVGEAGRQAVANIDDGNYTADPARDRASFKGYGWTTYAERLQRAGVSWKLYQEYDNYGDNALAFFASFRGLDPASELHKRGRAWAAGSTAQNLAATRGEPLVAAFAGDVLTGALPRVSWIVAPTKFCEHPDNPPSYGESLTARLLAALTANPAVWAKTVLFINYDENDGFFDHVPPPLPAVGGALGQSTVDTVGEIYDGVPVGLGPRVPMLVVSPWSKGGWVDSQTFDHTSVIRFLETRFGVAEPNITPWRRAVAGDLTSAFDFRHPERGRWSALPDTAGTMARVDRTAKLPKPAPPADQALPRQEKGRRPARALPYDLEVLGHVDEPEVGKLQLIFLNHGAAGAAFNLYAVQGSPRFYTVESGKLLTDALDIGKIGYDVSVFGPNGFVRRFRGGPGGTMAEVERRFDAHAGKLVITLRNTSDAPAMLTVKPGDYPAGGPRRYRLAPGGSARDSWRLDTAAAWYDLTVTNDADPGFLRQLAGHLETGRPSLSDPAIGRG
ncbi:MAG: phospholipase C, phosphocholine-specific [Pseudomonadota bacterium]|nr:phospholipase C, phosphocholine-specific [Pseudomonadota bacterium]